MGRGGGATAIQGQDHFGAVMGRRRGVRPAWERANASLPLEGRTDATARQARLVAWWLERADREGPLPFNFLLFQPRVQRIYREVLIELGEDGDEAVSTMRRLLGEDLNELGRARVTFREGIPGDDGARHRLSPVESWAREGAPVRAREVAHLLGLG
jgi:hypothetical protein